MSRARIKINGVIGSAADLPLNVLVSLSNDNDGGEATYAWTLVDRPEGSTSSLSSATAAAPTFTPDRAGSYLVQLIVDAGMATEARNRVVAGVLRLRTKTRTPAAGEALEVSATRGWADARNRDIGSLEDLVVGRGAVDIALNDVGQPTLAVGDVVVLTNSADVGTSLRVPRVAKASAASTTTAGPVGVVLGTLTAAASVAANTLCRVCTSGIVTGVNTSGSAVGAPVYLSDTAGAFSLSPGTVPQVLGWVVKVGVADGEIYVVAQGAGVVGAGTSVLNQTGSTIVTGSVMRISGAGNLVSLASASSAANSAGVIGIAQSAILNGAQGTAIIFGASVVPFDAGGLPATNADPVFLSATEAGKFAKTPPSTAGQVIYKLGFLKNFAASEVLFRPESAVVI